MSENWKIGDRIEGRYEIHSVKRGGMGIVFLCYDHDFKKPVAVKTFQDRFFSEKHHVDRFIWEAETWIRLGKHKNIVNADYILKISDRPYIFLELVTGHQTYGADLTGWISRGGLELQITLSFAIQFCFGMEHAQAIFKEMAKPFVHRDIKPGNIMVTRDGVIKITDFGLVKTFSLSGETINPVCESGSLRKAFSRAGTICGTPPYMSPEQCKGKEDLDIGSDIYAFGCVLYEMLTGRPPFDCPTFESYIFHHSNVNPKAPSEIFRALPDSLNGLIMRCLEKDTNSRYKDFTALREELLEIYFELVGGRFQVDQSPQELKAWEWNNRGIGFESLGLYEEAVFCFEQALEADPSYAQALVNKGGALTNYNKPDEAMVCFDMAIVLGTPHAELWNNRGVALKAMGKLEAAIKSYDEALKIDPKCSLAWCNKGAALLETPNVHDAVLCMERAIQISPWDAGTWNNIGAALLKAGQYLEADNCIDKALQINPDDPMILSNKASVLKGLGKGQTAIKFCDAALQIDPRNERAWYNKGLILLKMGKFEDSIPCFTKAIEINAGHFLAWNNMGAALESVGMYKEALKAYRHFIKLAPASYSVHVKRIAEAINEVEKLLKVLYSNSDLRCKAYVSGRCIDHHTGKDTGQCSWQPGNWRRCSVVYEIIKGYGRW